MALPSAPTNVRVVSQTAKTITITGSPGYSVTEATLPVNRYKVRYRDTFGTAFYETTSTKLPVTTAANLIVGHTYKLTLWNGNNEGWNARPGAELTVTVQSGMWIKVGGVWKRANPYVRHNGQWYPAESYYNDYGLWREGSV